MTTKLKSPPSVPGAVTVKVAGPTPPGIARTIASRQLSVRASAHEFQMPDAQFSVSKNQLIPQTGTVAATIAAIGTPIARHRQIAAGIEKRASRSCTAVRSRYLSHAAAARRRRPPSFSSTDRYHRHTVRSIQRVDDRNDSAIGAAIRNANRIASAASPTTAIAGAA